MQEEQELLSSAAETEARSGLSSQPLSVSALYQLASEQKSLGLGGGENDARIQNQLLKAALRRSHVQSPLSFAAFFACSPLLSSSDHKEGDETVQENCPCGFSLR